VVSEIVLNWQIGKVCKIAHSAKFCGSFEGLFLSAEAHPASSLWLVLRWKAARIVRQATHD
jgi:hypothetical protein